MKFWKKLTQEEKIKRIDQALEENVNFAVDASLGYPASKLDGRVFYDNAPFLKDAPTLKTFVANPNNIGCHTYGTSEEAFAGTQKIEREVLNVLAVDIFKCEENAFDGYISPGGTEANIQALWIFRNYFINEYSAKAGEIVIISSEDTHYSIPKASNLLQIPWLKIPVIAHNRKIDLDKLEELVVKAKSEGIKYFIIVSNLGTTMFGSVDDPDDYIRILSSHNLTFKLHVDGAYGGFVYPFSNKKSVIDFSNPHVSSITIDAHKMLQAPYGTGIFICRKGLITNVLTKEAEYVEGMDLTLCGSRSGSNAVAVWMILFTYGPNGWYEKISILQMRTRYLCDELDRLSIQYFREPNMNIVTVRAEYINHDLATKYDLVPQKHNSDNEWYKIVIMDHVEVEHLSNFIKDLEESITLEPTLN
jgi:tyrosine decarboxylase / aspartate 1-decarboxylase